MKTFVKKHHQMCKIATAVLDKNNIPRPFIKQIRQNCFHAVLVYTLIKIKDLIDAE